MIGFLKAYFVALFNIALIVILLCAPLWVLYAIGTALYRWPWVDPWLFGGAVLALTWGIKTLRILWMLTTHYGTELLEKIQEWLL